MFKFKRYFITGIGLIIVVGVSVRLFAQQRQEGPAPRFAAAGNPSSLGIGDIVMSTLDLRTFQAQHGGGTSTWVVCNGDSYPGSAWERVSGGQKVPDLTNRYPRGYAAGLPAPGGHMADALSNHHHELSGWAVMNDARGGGDNQVLRTGYGGATPTSGVIGIDNSETRPKTTVVVFYIRIN
jgi:hypothetical protein